MVKSTIIILCPHPRKEDRKRIPVANVDMMGGDASGEASGEAF